MTETNRATVLIVDDEEPLLQLYRNYLEDEFAVITASGGQTALEQINESVNVVLLDRRMPDMSGDELLEALRDRGFEGLISMVTAVEPDIDIIDMPFDDYLVKPVGSEQLQDHVSSLVRRRTYDQAIRDHFSVASKIAVLQADHPPESLAENDEYLALTEQLEATRADAERTNSDLSEAEAEALFRDLEEA